MNVDRSWKIPYDRIHGWAPEKCIFLAPCQGDILYAKHDGEVQGRWGLKKPIFLWSIAARKTHYKIS